MVNSKCKILTPRKYDKPIVLESDIVRLDNGSINNRVFINCKFEGLSPKSTQLITNSLFINCVFEDTENLETKDSLFGYKRHHYKYRGLSFKACEFVRCEFLDVQFAGDMYSCDLTDCYFNNVVVRGSMVDCYIISPKINGLKIASPKFCKNLLIDIVAKYFKITKLTLECCNCMFHFKYFWKATTDRNSNFTIEAVYQNQNTIKKS